jgi:hypothetical protein
LLYLLNRNSPGFNFAAVFREGFTVVEWGGVLRESR